MTLTPMMQQYREAKERHPGMLLLFRMGDFYELFESDAETASRVLGLTFTTPAWVNNPFLEDPEPHQQIVHVTFSKEGLARLRNGLTRAGLDPRFFAWPPADEPNRPPYRGFKPLEAEDAGIQRESVGERSLAVLASPRQVSVDFPFLGGFEYAQRVELKHFL